MRKKKKTDTGPNWESDTGEEEDEANPSEEYSYVVDTEIDDEGNVVEIRRRVKADQKMTTYDKFSKNMSKVFIGFSVVTALVLVGAVGYLMKTGVSQDAAVEEETVKRDTGEITQEITDEAFEVIQKYLTVNTWSERVQLVRNPNDVRPLMEAYYEEHPFEKREGAVVIEYNGEPVSRREFVDRPEKSDRLEAIFVAVVFPFGDFQYFALERKKILGSADKYEYLIDWEISEGHSSIPELKFKTDAIPGSAAEFRVSLQAPGTYFQPPFDDRSVWRCYSLTYPGNPDFQFFGYTRKGSEIDDEILALFASSGRPTPIVKVAFPKDKVYDQVCVEITELIQSTWFM